MIGIVECFIIFFGFNLVNLFYFLLYEILTDLYIYHQSCFWILNPGKNYEQLLLVQDGKLYGRDTIFSVIVKAAALPEVTKYHDIQKNEYILQLGQVKNCYVLWFIHLSFLNNIAI